jgi:NAD(P)H-hydrate epimerase
MERGTETKEIVNTLLTKYPTKKWVVDGGALQEVDPKLLTESMIVTPNIKELKLLPTSLPCTILSKGPTDTISLGDQSATIASGSPGMTKGGTGDVLAGLVAGLYAKSSSFASCVVASYTNKKSSEELEKAVGPFFSPTDLIKQIPKTLKEIYG